jgi:hypothetical protein
MDTEDLDLSIEVPLPDTPLPPLRIQSKKPTKGKARHTRGSNQLRK